MKKLNVTNSEDQTITVVINFNQDIIIQPKETVQIQTNGYFNSEDFYVDGADEGNWQAKYTGENNENLTLYINQFHGWSSYKSEDGSSEVANPL